MADTYAVPLCPIVYLLDAETDVCAVYGNPKRLLGH